MKKLVYVLALLLMGGGSCKKKEPAAEPMPTAEKPGMPMEQPAKAPETGMAGPMMTEVEIVPEGGAASTMISYMDGKNSRMEMYQGAGADKKLIMVHLMKDNEMYMLDPANKKGTKMAGGMMHMGGPAESQTGKYETWKEWMDAEGAKAGTNVENKGAENWNGEDYTVYRVTTADRSYLDYYVDKNEMIKRWVVYDGAGKKVQELRMLKFEKNAAMPAGALDIPSDYQIQDMKMPGMPGMNR